MSNGELLVVFEGSPIEVSLLKSILDSEDIQCFKKDEHMGSLASFYTSVGGVGAVKLLVPRSQIEKARPLIEHFLDNR